MPSMAMVFEMGHTLADHNFGDPARNLRGRSEAPSAMFKPSGL